MNEKAFGAIEKSITLHRNNCKECSCLGAGLWRFCACHEAAFAQLESARELLSAVEVMHNPVCDKVGCDNDVCRIARSLRACRASAGKNQNA